MILPKREDAIHKAQMYRLLSEIIDDNYLASNIYFKGGSCAAMLGFLDRFSIDLDFDLGKRANKTKMDKRLQGIFENLDLEIKNKSPESLFYLLKYQSPTSLRNTIKLSIVDLALKSNQYRPFYLSEIDRVAICQTKETMFANKLVAVADRYKKYRTIAGRDIYDIDHFFLQGFQYHEPIIKERTGLAAKQYLIKLSSFIKQKVNEKILAEDLNYLLPSYKFKAIRKTLKQEVLMFINDEINRLS